MTLPSFEQHGNGRAVIFLHGIGSGKEGWHHQITPVVEAGFTFIAIDAPGFGNTPLPAEPGFATHRQSVLDVMDHLEIASAILVGHSLGGMTAQDIAAEQPGRVDGLVLSATSPAFGRPDGDFQRQFLKSRLEPFEQGLSMAEFAAQFSSRLLAKNSTDAALREVKRVLSRIDIAAYKSAMMTLTQFDRRAALADIAVPCLLIAGDEDANAPAQMMEKTASKIAGAELVVLPQTGHMAPVENPNGFNRAVVGFLEQFA